MYVFHLHIKIYNFYLVEWKIIQFIFYFNENLPVEFYIHNDIAPCILYCICKVHKLNKMFEKYNKN